LHAQAESDAFRNFVAPFGKLLPLRKASAFGQREMVRLLLDLSEGITGRATRLISRAAADVDINNFRPLFSASGHHRSSTLLRITY
jgi:hypothetical protein